MREFLKRAVLTGILLSLMPLLLWQNETVAQAVREGLSLCTRSVIPSLFPFFVTVSFAVSCGFFSSLRQLHIPTPVAVFLLGIIGGYPLGGRTVGALYRGGTITRQQAEALLTCCNNAGPAFILSIAGTGVFGSTRTGLVLYGIHVLSALAAGGLLGAFRRTESAPTSASLPLQPRTASLCTAFVSCVRDAALSMVSVCAFVVFFLALMALLRQIYPLLPPLALGLLELTGGIAALPNSAAGFCMAAALLGWGGVSVHCQTAAVLEGSGLSLRRYLSAKILHGLLSALMALAVCRFLF